MSLRLSVISLVLLSSVCAGRAAAGQSAPTIEQPSNQSNLEHDTIAPFEIVATDPNNSSLTYQVTNLPLGLTFDPDTHLVSGTIDWHAFDVVGLDDRTVHVTVTNAELLSDQKTFVWTVLQVNAPPSGTVVQTLPQDQSGAYLVSTPRGVPVSPIELAATDPDRCDIVGFYTYLGETLPPGLSVSQNPQNPSCTPDLVFSASIVGTPTVDGVTAFTLRYGVANPLVSFVWTVTNTAPEVTAPAPQTAEVGTPFALSVSGTDENGDTLTFAATGLPLGLSLNPLTSEITGTPLAAGTFLVGLQAVDGHGGTATGSFDLTVGGTSITPSCGGDGEGGRTPGAWCEGDLWLAAGVLQYAPDPTLPRPGEYVQLDAMGQPLGASLFDRGLDQTMACAVDPHTGDLWTTGLWTNLISHVVAPTGTTAPTLLDAIDVTPYTRTAACGTVPGNPRAGCGSAVSLVFDQAGDVYVGTVDGTNQILKFSAAGAFLQAFTVPVGTRGAGWLDLAADQRTMFYTSEDTYIRVFRVDGQPLDHALFDAGVEHLWDATLDPDSLGLFGRIVVKGTDDLPINHKTFQVRVLPPGDGSGGLLVAWHIQVSRINLGGHVIQNYPLSQVYSFEITPDGRSIWMSSLAGGDWTTPTKLMRAHLATGWQEIGPLSGPGATAAQSLCMAGAYTAALRQPDCALDPGNNLCQPSPTCWIGDPTAGCTPYGTPEFDVPPNQTNDEGDTITPVPIVATSPNGSALTYSVAWLPFGLSYDQATHVITGTVDWRASEIIGQSATTVRVDVTTAQGLLARKYFSWTIVPKDAPPSATVSPALPQDATGAYLVTTPRGVPIPPVTLVGTDPDWCDTVGFYLYNGETLPPGISLVPGTPSNTPCHSGTTYPATISGTPILDGETTFTLSYGTAHPLASFVWTATNLVPAIASVATQTANVGEPFSLTILASDGNQDALSFTAQNLPAGLTIDVGSGVVSGTPTSVGSTMATVTVSDAYGGEDIVSFLVTVTDPGCTLFITPTSITAPAEGRTGYVSATGTGPTCTQWMPTSNAGWLTLDTPIFDQWEGYVQRVLSDDPVGYWGFHEVVGATTDPDVTGHGLTATLEGGAVINQLGYADFDGVGARVVVSASPLLTMTNGLTAEAWVNTVGESGRVMGAEGDPWELYVTTGGVMELRLLGQTLVGQQPVNDGEDHFIDATWDGATAALYVDGILDAQTPAPGTLASSAGGLMMGAHPTRGDYYTGRLAAVAVVDRALTAAQVADRWLWFNGEQGDNSGVFGYTVAANASLTPRTASITIQGLTVPVSQAAAPATTTLTITTPGDGTTLTSPAAVTVRASVTTNGTITSVEFYDDAAFLGVATAEPYQVSWLTPALGLHVLTARAIDDQGHDTWSPAVAVTITDVASPPVITSVSPTSGGAGTPVVVSGTNFGTFEATSALWLGTKPGAVLSWSDNENRRHRRDRLAVRHGAGTAGHWPLEQPVVRGCDGDDHERVAGGRSRGNIGEPGGLVVRGRAGQRPSVDRRCSGRRHELERHADSGHGGGRRDVRLRAGPAERRAEQHRAVHGDGRPAAHYLRDADQRRGWHGRDNRGHRLRRLAGERHGPSRWSVAERRQLDGHAGVHHRADRRAERRGEAVQQRCMEQCRQLHGALERAANHAVAECHEPAYRREPQSPSTRRHRRAGHRVPLVVERSGRRQPLHRRPTRADGGRHRAGDGFHRRGFGRCHRVSRQRPAGGHANLVARRDRCYVVHGGAELRCGRRHVC